MNEISLETIYNIIEFCKYSEVEGEKAELIVSPGENDSRNIRIGINGGFSREYFEYSYLDGKVFDKEVLPLMVNYFLKDDKISSWVTNDPDIEEYPTKELIVSEKENEILIQTFDKELHELIKDNAEKIQLNNEEVEFTKEELACEKILKYLKEKNKNRPELAKLEDNLRLEIISIIDNAYKLNKGKTLTDEQIYNFADNIHDGITKEAYNAIVSDIRNNNSLLINEVRDYLRNEHKYENYLDEEPYMSLSAVGEKMIEKGYFEIRYVFPQKAELLNLNKEELEKVLTSRYKSKYKLLAEMKNEADANKNEEVAKVLDIYMSYLVKTTRAKINKKNKNAIINNKAKETKFKENKQEYKLDDSKTLIDALKLYKGGKLDSEKLEVIVKEEDNNYEINIRLSSGTSRDNNLFKFSKNEVFINEIIPNLIKEFENGDLVKEEKEKDSKLLLISTFGNEILIDKNLVKNAKYGESKTEEPKVQENKVDEPIKNETTDEASKVEDNTKADPVVEPVKKEESNNKDDNAGLESDSKYLASYFRKEILRDKGLLSPAGLSEIKSLESQSEDVRVLEEARRKVQEGTLTQAKYDELHRHYRDLLSKNVKRGLQRPERKNTISKEENETITSDKETEFDYLHELLTKYKIQNINGELKTINRETKADVTFNDEDELLAVEFANYWNSAAGIKSINDKDILGETYAFGSECRKLFDIIFNNFNGEYLDFVKIEDEFKNSGISTSHEIYERLFRDQNHKDFVISGLKCFKKALTTKELDVEEENLDLKAIKDEFSRLDEISSVDTPANMIIEYKNNGIVEVRLQDEKSDDTTELTLSKTIKENYFNENMLDEVVKHFVSLEGVFKTKLIERENEKCSIIAIGKNSNVLQIRDIDKKHVKRIDDIIDNTKDVLEPSDGYGTK
jgi:hypothetical protein